MRTEQGLLDFSLGPWEGETKGTSLAFFAFEDNCTTLPNDDLTSHKQAQPVAIWASTLSVCSTVKFAEEFVLFGLRDTKPRVRYAELNRLGV